MGFCMEPVDLVAGFTFCSFCFICMTRVLTRIQIGRRLSGESGVWTHFLTTIGNFTTNEVRRTTASK
jgi:hypothetical protein